MINCFLSHSSKDKKSYVEVVADNVGLVNCVYDEFSFETGMRPLDEILQNLEQTDLFVLFISESALESDWVKIEITNAKKRIDSGQILKIFPLIIDENIKYSDTRIPEWMRSEYNLKFISRPVVAARRIRQRLREISWKVHPNLKSGKNIFVGRNMLIQNFEERIDDFDEIKPTCIIASGVPAIGRRSLTEYCFIKSNIVADSYSPPYISLNSTESIEDLILKVFDLGFSESIDRFNFLTKPIQEKIKSVVDLALDIQKAKEIVFIIDDGCIVTYDRRIRSWFTSVLLRIVQNEMLTFCVISRFHPAEHDVRHQKSLFCIDVPELEPSERKGLFKRYSDSIGLDLSRTDLNWFANLLTGYPDQVYFTAQLINENGLSEAKKNSFQIVEYNNLKVQILLKKWDDNEETIHFLRLLSEFDFISHELVLEIVDDNDFYNEVLKEFRAHGIIELIGANKEYIRVLENIRDYIHRQKLRLHRKFKTKLSKHVNAFLDTYKEEDKDLSDFLYSLKISLKENKAIDEKYLLPSHFIKTIRELYERDKKYNEVVKFSDQILKNKKFLDDRFLRDIRYYLCLALARLRNKRCLKEAHAFEGADLNFILGFYFRLMGRYSDAIDKLSLVLKDKPDFQRAKRELVLVFQFIGEYKMAMELARQNYENGKLNPFHIQAYLDSLLKDIENKEKNQKIILALLDGLKQNGLDRAREMYLTANAEYLAFHENQEQPSFNLVDDAKAQFPKIIYPILTEFDISVKFNNVEKMTKSLSDIERIVKENSYFHNAFMRRKCIFIAKTESSEKAIEMMEKHMQNYTDQAKEKLSILLYNCTNKEL
jgi:hypothetical protein